MNSIPIPSPATVEVAFTGLILAWTALAALFVLTAGYLRFNVHGRSRDLRTWQWGVFFHFGAAMFIFIIASHFVALRPILIVLEGILMLATALIYLALLVHVCWSELEKYPVPVALRALGRLVDYLSHFLSR